MTKGIKGSSTRSSNEREGGQVTSLSTRARKQRKSRTPARGGREHTKELIALVVALAVVGAFSLAPEKEQAGLQSAWALVVSFVMRYL